MLGRGLGPVVAAAIALLLGGRCLVWSALHIDGLFCRKFSKDLFINDIKLILTDLDSKVAATPHF